VGVADHQLDASEAALFQRGDELFPEALALAITHLQAQQFAAAIGIGAHVNYHGPGADLQSLAQTAVDVGGIEPQATLVALLDRPAQERLHLLVDLLTDTAHLGARDAALHLPSRHQGVDLAGGDARRLRPP